MRFKEELNVNNTIKDLIDKVELLIDSIDEEGLRTVFWCEINSVEDSISDIDLN